MRLYKVLRVVGDEVISPFEGFLYGELSDVIGKEFVCDDFDESNEKCSRGFYATGVDGLVYSLNGNGDNRVFEVEVSGKSKEFDAYKRRYEKMQIVKMLEPDEVERLIKKQSDKMGFDYYHACYPVDPRKIEAPEVDDKVIGLLKEWSAVRGFVWASVEGSVWCSVLDSVLASVWCSVAASVWASVSNSVWYSVRDVESAYIGSLFHNIKKWKYIEHENGVYPFQSAVDLIHMGFVPSFDGGKWMLCAGKDMKVVFEISEKDLLEIR